MAAGALATYFGGRASARTARPAFEDEWVLEGIASVVVSVLAFHLGAMGASADISRPLVAALAVYVLGALWLIRRRKTQTSAA